MTTYAAVVMLGLAGAVDRARPAVAFGLLDAALTKAWAEADPRGLVDAVLRAAVAVDPDAARRRVRQASDKLAGLRLPPLRRSIHGELAPLVAAHDRQLRDVLLARAVAEARAALAFAPLWQAPAARPPGVPLVEPQKSVDQERQLLTFSARLWEGVLQAGVDRAAGLADLGRLLADARAAGYHGSDALFEYEHTVLGRLADLDPALLLAGPPAGWGKKELATYCGHQAYHRWVNGQRDAFTGTLAARAVAGGVTSENVFKVYKHYDVAGAWAAAEKLPADRANPGSGRGGLLGGLIADFAWHDPDAALAAAEREPDADIRRELVDQVARVWAYKKPDQIERAVRDQDNEVRRGWARDAAADELAWRARGHPPRTTRGMVPTMIRAMTREERAARGLPRGNPEEIRILDKPGDTAWLVGPNRRMFLRQAAGLSHLETGRLDGVFQIVAGLTDPAEVDDVLCATAEWAGSGAIGPAVELLGRVKSPRRSVLTACAVARSIARPPRFGE